MFGQYSYNGVGRLTKEQLTPSLAAASRKAGHNRVIWTRANGEQRYRLIGTDVVVRYPDGTFLLDDGGYPTMTTRRAMLQGLAALGCKMNPNLGGDKRAGTDHVYCWFDSGFRRKMRWTRYLRLDAMGRPIEALGAFEA